MWQNSKKRNIQKYGSLKNEKRSKNSKILSDKKMSEKSVEAIQK